MDIRITSAYNAYSVTRTKNTVATPRGTERARPNADSISLSAQASDFQLAMKAVANAPDVREDLTNQIQARIAAGNYNVSPHDVAARIFHGLE